MKKLILIVAVIIAPFTTSAQSIFDKYEDVDAVTTIVVTK